MCKRAAVLGGKGGYRASGRSEIFRLGKLSLPYFFLALSRWNISVNTRSFRFICYTDRYKLWADECAKMFGGLDILCVEVIQTADGKEYIIEVYNNRSKMCNVYIIKHDGMAVCVQYELRH